MTANSSFRQQSIRQAKWKQRSAKCRTAAAASVITKEVPHMEWSGDSFKPCSPKPLPSLQISAEILHRSHTQFGISQPPASVSNPVKLSAFADSCCQTCTAGEEFLNQLKYPSNSLIPTSHRIVGITDDSLGVMGAVMVKFYFNGRTSRQMVYISNNVEGLFLSQKALQDLDILSENFPHSCNVARSCACTLDDSDNCNCPARNPTPERPAEIPFPPTVENVGKLENWFLQTFESSAFNTCEEQPLQEMSGTPVNIRFKEDAKPHAVHTAIPVAHYWKKKVKRDLDRDVKLGIIEPVPQGSISQHCSRMVVTAKKDGSPRRVVDMQKVNQATLREVHHTPSPFNLVSTVPAKTKKTILDAWNGYHSLPINPEHKDATTFITEWGRYRYCRAPMGLHTSGDAYTRRFDDITCNTERKVRCIDDTLLWDESIESAFWHTFDYIKLCADNGIVFNKEKFAFAKDVVEFAGFEVTQSGFRPPSRIIDAIKKFPLPNTITDVRSWFGLVNQVAYAFMQKDQMSPFRELLAGKKRVWKWDATLTEAFEKSKQAILDQIKHGVQNFDLNRKTCLATDWSKTGVGFVLSQKHCDCLGESSPNCGEGHWKVVFMGSRFLKEAESRYAPIEGEALAVAYALEKCKMFVLGCPDLTIATDHQPLINILNDRSLETISNPRVSQLKQKTLRYSFKIIHVPGITNKGPDFTSRYPATGSSQPNMDLVDEPAVATCAALRAKEIPAVSWSDIMNAAIRDEECASLVQAIRNGFPKSKSELAPDIRQFWHMRDSLYEVDSVPFCDHKMLIPKPLRGQVLEGLHAAHQGHTGMLANARQRFFWPGLDASIRATRKQCRQCNKNAPSQQAEPTVPSPEPEYPFQLVVTDLFSLQGHTFLVYADRYTGWVEVFRAKSTSFAGIKKAFLAWFAAYGVPEEISSDGGPPFNGSEFALFLDRWHIRPRKSSAYYPQSNGRAEAAVKTAKRILEGNISPTTGQLDTDNACQAFLNHRNTPNQETGIAPSVALYGHTLRDHLPSHAPIRREWQEIADAREVAHAKRHTRPQKEGKQLTALNVGDTIQLQNQRGNNPKKWHATGTIISVLPHRQYEVMVDGSRRITLRNRRFIRKIDPVCRPQSPYIMPAFLPQYSSTVPRYDRSPIEPPLSDQGAPSSPIDSSSGNTQTALPKPKENQPEQSIQPEPDILHNNSLPNKPTPVADNNLNSTNIGDCTQKVTNQLAMQRDLNQTPEQKGSNRPNWRVPENNEQVHTRSRRQRFQRQIYDAATGSYRDPISK